MTEEVAQVAVEPVATVEVAPAVTVEPVVAPVVAEPVAAEPVAVVEPTSILGEALKPAEQSSTVEPEVAPVEAKEPEGQSVEPAPPPSYETFTLPEGLALEGEGLNEFTTILGQFETQTKADHAEVQKLGQSLLDRHVAEVKKAVAEIASRYEAQQKTTATAEREQWKQDFINHPEIGGNRQETTVNAALNFIRTHGGTSEQQAEFTAVLNKTGLGNHPAIIGMLARAGSAMSEGRPLPAQTPMSAPVSKIQKMYGGRTA